MSFDRLATDHFRSPTEALTALADASPDDELRSTLERLRRLSSSGEDDPTVQALGEKAGQRIERECDVQLPHVGPSVPG